MKSPLKILAAVGVLLSSMTLSAQAPEPPSVPEAPADSAGRTLRVAFAHCLGAPDKETSVVTGAPADGYVNVIPSSWGGHQHYAVSAAKLLATDGNASPWGIEDFSDEVCGAPMPAALGTVPSVVAYFPGNISGKLTPEIDGKTYTYTLGSPIQKGYLKPAPGFCTLTGVSPAVAYDVVILGGRPNGTTHAPDGTESSKAAVTETVYGFENASIVRPPMVLGQGVHAETAVNPDYTATVKVPTTKAEGYWSLIAFRVRPHGNTLKVTGSPSGNIIALSLTEVRPEAEQAVVFSSEYANGGDTTKKAGGNVVWDSGVNRFQVHGSAGMTEGYPSGTDMLVTAAKGLKTVSGEASPWTFKLFPNKNSYKLGLKVTGPGEDVRLDVTHFTPEQKALVETHLGSLDQVVGSKDTPNRGAPIQSDVDAPGIEVGDVLPGRCYTLTALVGRSNFYAGKQATRPTHSVTGGEVLSACILAERLGKGQTAGEVTAAKTVVANSAPNQDAQGPVWTLMAFNVRATEPVLTFRTSGMCGNIKALKVSELKSFNGREPMMVSFETRDNPGTEDTHDGTVVASIANGARTVTVPLDPTKDAGMTGTDNKRFAGCSGVFYRPTGNNIHPLFKTGNGVSVNTQLCAKPDHGEAWTWYVEVPVEEMNVAEFIAHHNRVTPVLSAINMFGQMQSNNEYDFGYRVDIVSNDANETVWYTTGETMVTCHVARSTSKGVSAPGLLMPTAETATASGLGFRIRVTLGMVDAKSTFAGLHSLRFDASAIVPETVKIGGRDVPVADALRNAVYAAAGVETDLGEVTIVPGKVASKDITVEQMNNAVELFDGIVVKRDAAKVLAAEPAASAPAVFDVGYDFGIADMVVSGDTLTAMVGLQGPNASEASLKPGVTVKLLKDDGTETGAAFNRETMTLTLKGFGSGEGVPKFTVKAEK